MTKMSQTTIKILTVIALLAATIEVSTAKKNILEELMFMGFNQIDPEIFDQVKIEGIHTDGQLFNDLIRVLDPNPREIVGISLPINPLPSLNIMTKLAYAFMPMDVDSIMDQVAAVGHLGNTVQMTYDGLTYAKTLVGGLIAGNTTSTQPAAPAKQQPKPSESEGGLLTSLFGQYFNKKPVDKTESKMTTMKTTTLKPKTIPVKIIPADKLITTTTTDSKPDVNVTNNILVTSDLQPKVNNTETSPVGAGWFQSIFKTGDSNGTKSFWG